MARWNDLSPTSKTVVAVLGSLDLTLKAVALRDLATRDADAIRGPKALWAAALTVAATGGALPAAYLLWGRRG